MYFMLVSVAEQAGLSLTWAKVHTDKVCVKFKDFSRTSKKLSYSFQGLKTYD